MRAKLNLVICVRNKAYAAPLELRKIYQVIPDKAASNLRQVRVIDESGEDYLYPDYQRLLVSSSSHGGFFVSGHGFSRAE